MLGRHPIVGVWYVQATEAPFGRHVFTFHADGTVLQANPDAGDAATSDSVGMGVWESGGDIVRANFVEVTADRQSHAFVSKGVIHFMLSVEGDRFTGLAEARFYDEQDRQVRGPLPSHLEGRRVQL